MLAADAASGSLGIQLVHLEPGIATVTMTIRPSMINGHAVGHGGYVFLLADTAFACACNTHGPVTVGASADITYIKPVHVGDQLTARATERTRYGRSGIYDVTVLRGTEVIAEFRGRSRTVERATH
jgi:acyl-CoA thioesterase